MKPLTIKNLIPFDKIYSLSYDSIGLERYNKIIMNILTPNQDIEYRWYGTIIFKYYENGTVLLDDNPWTISTI